MSGTLAFFRLGLAAILLASLVALELAWNRSGGVRALDAVEAAAVLDFRPASVAPDPPAAELLAAWADTALRRPLFAPDRRSASPPPSPEQPPAAPATPEDLPRLTGVMVGPGGRAAIFAAAETGAKPAVLREGGFLGPYEVTRIAEGRVTVLGPEGERVLRPSHLPRTGGPDARPPAATPWPALAASASLGETALWPMWTGGRAQGTTSPASPGLRQAQPPPGFPPGMTPR